MRLWGINPTKSVFIPQSLALRSIVLVYYLCCQGFGKKKFCRFKVTNASMWISCSISFRSFLTP